MKKHLYIIFLVAIFSCDDAEQMLTPLIPDTSEVPVGMVLIPAGEVLLGAPVSDVHVEQITHGIVDPERIVFVDAFYIDTHEVTIAEYQDFVEATGYNQGYHWWRESTPRHPVFASYLAARAYAEWAGKRLPTADEWEKAARGGLVGKRYPWGNDTPTEAHGKIGNRNAPRPYTAPVGSYPPNGYGLYDMAGNLAEWVDEEYKIYGDTWSFVRGGSWFNADWFLRNYARDTLIASHPMHGYIAGFRCVADVTD